MSKIEWTDKTWNPVTGCNKVSQGCKNCYAEVMHRRQMHMNPHKYSKPFLDGVQIHPEEFDKLDKFKAGTKVFVNSMSDLFHPDVPFDFIEDVYARMGWHSDKIFQILTKRPERMLQYYKEYCHGWMKDNHCEGAEHIWIGVSCEDQKTANERIPLLLQVPAAVRFLSCEPLLGPIDLDDFILDEDKEYLSDFPDWIIAGGESGHNARPVHPDWIRYLRDACEAAEIPFFFKQWGEYIPYEPTAQPPYFRDCSTGFQYDGHGMNHIDPETSEAGKWNGHRWMDPMDAIVFCDDTNSSDCSFLKVGKHNSGNFLDGKQHLQFPKS